MDHSRDPCPWVALSDFGGAFSMGAIGGSVWHGIKGFRNSPYGERRIGMITAIKARAPVTGGNFGVWGGMFSTYDCAVKGIRKKEDPYNSIIAGFLTGGSLAVRGGWRAARNGAIMCGIFLAVIEGVGIGIQRMMAENTRLDVSITVLVTAGRIVTDLCCSYLHQTLCLRRAASSRRRDSNWLRFHISSRRCFLPMIHKISSSITSYWTRLSLLFSLCDDQKRLHLHSGRMAYGCRAIWIFWERKDTRGEIVGRYSGRRGCASARSAAKPTSGVQLTPLSDSRLRLSFTTV